MLNGDHLYNNFIKKHFYKKEKKEKKTGMKQNPCPRRLLENTNIKNLMDVKQLLVFTKDRLEYLSSNHSEKVDKFEVRS